MRMMVWSLVDKQHVLVVTHPKYPDRGFSFRHDGRYLAIAERKDAKDCICVYHTSTWELAKVLSYSTHNSSLIK